MVRAELASSPQPAHQALKQLVVLFPMQGPFSTQVGQQQHLSAFVMVSWARGVNNWVHHIAIHCAESLCISVSRQVVARYGKTLTAEVIKVGMQRCVSC